MKKAVLNISIDDMSPHSMSSVGVLDACYTILDKFPDAKISLFVPTAYWRVKNDRYGNLTAETSSDKPYRLSEYPWFCDILRGLPLESFEVGYHGHYHSIPDELNNNDEFRYLNYQEAVLKFESMFDEVRKSNLEGVFSNIFRPPAWRMSSDAIIAVAKLKLFDVLSLALERQIRKDYKESDKSFKKTTYYNVSPPWKELRLFDKTTIVYHACEWSPNFLGHNNLRDLMEFLEENRGLYDFGKTSDLIGNIGMADTLFSNTEEEICQQS